MKHALFSEQVYLSKSRIIHFIQANRAIEYLSNQSDSITNPRPTPIQELPRPAERRIVGAVQRKSERRYTPVAMPCSVFSSPHPPGCRRDGCGERPCAWVVRNP